VTGGDLIRLVVRSSSRRRGTRKHDGSRCQPDEQDDQSGDENGKEPGRQRQVMEWAHVHRLGGAQYVINVARVRLLSADGARRQTEPVDRTEPSRPALVASLAEARYATSCSGAGTNARRL
jgi:hypothetical protein